jgi:ABC-type multidrug transport system fused ATPase/permease subunit
LILDEPTSSLDVASEATVLKAISAASEKRTTVIITHRLTAAKMADRILMLAEGQIREQGTYQELIDANQDFSRLVLANASPSDTETL